MEGGGGRLGGEINTFSYFTLYKTPLSTIHVQLYDKNNNSNITNLGHFPFNSWKYNLWYLSCIKFMFFFCEESGGILQKCKAEMYSPVTCSLLDRHENGKHHRFAM